MANSRKVICDLLDEALIELEGTLDEPLEDECIVNSSTVDSSTSLTDTSNVVDVHKTSSPSNAPKDSNDKLVFPEKSNKKRTWKKPKDKPKRPLSAYNLFFQHERESIIAGRSTSEMSTEEIFAILKSKENRLVPKKKRRHRKSHGKISFGNLARSIADQWKTLDKARRAVFENEAAQEKIRYKRELEEWNQKRNEKNNPTIPLVPALPGKEQLSGLLPSVNNMMEGANKPLFSGCNLNQLNAMTYPNHLHNYHELMQMQLLHEEMFPYDRPSRSCCGGCGNSNCMQHSHRGGCDPVSLCYNQQGSCQASSSLSFTPNHHAFSSFPMKMGACFPGAVVDSQQQQSSINNLFADGYNDKEEFSDFEPIIDDEPLDFTPMASFGEDTKSSTRNENESSTNLQDELSFFMTNLENEPKTQTTV